MVQIFFSFQDYHSSLEMAKKEYSISHEIGDVTINSLSQLADSYLRVDSSQQAGSIAKIMEKYIDKHAAVDTYEVLVPEVDLTGYATNAYVDEKIWVGTQEEFDAIVTKNPNTIYLVKE